MIASHCVTRSRRKHTVVIAAVTKGMAPQVSPAQGNDTAGPERVIHLSLMLFGPVSAKPVQIAVQNTVSATNLAVQASSASALRVPVDLSSLGSPQGC